MKETLDQFDDDELDSFRIPQKMASKANSLALLDPRVGEVLADLPDLGELGRGGMGEVRCVRDPPLSRDLALKVLARDASPDQMERFLKEAQITARLQHPGIVPIYAMGRLPDGRLAYAMQLIRGRTLASLFKDFHRAVRDGQWMQLEDGWSFRKLLDIFLRICETVAYAHHLGIVHRDLKPDNVMIGAFGEVQVLDWGLAADIGTEGETAGTPIYMAPEQVHRDVAVAATDVWGLGAILHELLMGKAPFHGIKLADIQNRPAPVFAPLAPVPEEIERIWRTCLQPSPGDRFADAGVLAQEVSSFLEGARRREQALEKVAEADAVLPQILALQQEASRARSLARLLLEPLPPHAPVSEKMPGWEAEDRVRRLEEDVEHARFERWRLLHAALELEPDLSVAHQALANWYMDVFVEAEQRSDRRAAREAERNLRLHDRGTHSRWLAGEGRLSLQTDPPGAQVELFRWEEQNRRLVAVWDRSLGTTPLQDVPLPSGRYLLHLSVPGRPVVQYPVQIDRMSHWDGIAPGETEPHAVSIPAIWPSGCSYVPAGWFYSGGDPEAADSAPRRRQWVDGFFLDNRPVTVEEWLVFLNDLLVTGSEELPKRLGTISGTEIPLFGKDTNGLFHCDTLKADIPWATDWPMTMVSYEDACAYARWRGQREGWNFRLPHALEREKAGRGVDGRLFPWGDHFDATWACVQTSHESRISPVSVHQYPGDISPYGIRWLAGGISEWCVQRYRKEGQPDGRIFLEEPGNLVEVRGGWWGGQSRSARLASRFASGPTQKFEAVGFRLLVPVR